MIVTLAGNPNSGKTTLFNALTGATAHVGNWPGVTIDKRSGFYKKDNENISIVDLPGIYSLSPYTLEEVIARNFILDEKPDCIIDVVDSTNLERNLYLTTQLLELDVPVVVALNMSDVLKKDKTEIDINALKKKFGVPFVNISALTGEGIEELMKEVKDFSSKPRYGKFVFDDPLILKVKNLYAELNLTNISFRAIKAIENDEIEILKIRDILPKIEEIKKRIDTNIFEDDYEGYIADSRYKFIQNALKGVVKKASEKDFSQLTKSDKIDKILTHKYLGIPIFLFIMLAVFHLTFSENFLFLGGWLIPESFDNAIFGSGALNSPGVILFNLMDTFTVTIGDFLGGILPEGTWYTGLILDGLFGGVFAVLSFVPQILVLFLFLSILEDSGYMARIAFIMDRTFRQFGLSGKAFMPLVMCFGCAVPGIMATRTLENSEERKRAIFIAPFFSCGAKLPIWAAFAGVFASARNLNAELTVYSMYLLGILIAIIASFLLKSTIIKGETPPFIMELPAYRSPKLRNTLIHLWQKLRHYLIRAGTIIAAATIIIWFLSSFTFTFQMVEDGNPENSILGLISKHVFLWFFYPLGFAMGENGWMFVVATLTGLIAKEIVVATMGVFAGMSGDEALETQPDELSAIENSQFLHNTDT